MIEKCRQFVEKLIKNQPLMIAVAVVSTILMLALPSIFNATFDGVPTKVTNHWVNFLGHFHTLVLHLPIGVILLVLTMEIIGFFSTEYKINMTIPLMFNAVTAVLACVLGMLWMYGGAQGEGNALNSHMGQGLIFSVGAIWLPLVYNWCKAKMMALYQVALFGSVIIMTSASHIGGELQHGELMSYAPWNQKEKKDKKKPLDPDHDPVFFVEFVEPIFESKCYSCHHSDK